MGRKQWERSNGTIEKQRDKGLITVANLMSSKAWEYWKDGFDAPKKADLSAMRDEDLLAGLVRYTFPVSIVLSTAPDEALANIFVTINQQGIKLTTFDLVVAKTVRRAKGSGKGFNLRDVWESSAGREESDDEPAIPPKHERIRNFDVDPELPLRLVRLMVDGNAKLSDFSILKLSASDVHQRVPRALEVIDGVLQFLEKRTGLIPQTLADSNYLLPIALAAHRKPAVLKNQRDSERLLTWYWASIFRMTFGRGRTGDLIPKEAASLLDWIIDFGSEPEVVTGFWSAFEQDVKFRFFQGTAQNQHMMRALFALEAAAGATDWRGEADDSGAYSEFLLSDAGGWPRTPLDIHHMWAQGTKRPPKSKTKVRGVEVTADDVYETVINRCLLLKATNIAVGNTPFPSVTQIANIDADHIATYLIDHSAKTWPSFVEARFDRIVEALEARVPKA
jgi:hypothetical protein